MRRVVAVTVACMIESIAMAEGESPETRVQEIARAIQVLQPMVSDDCALRLADIIVDASDEHSIPPLLVVAVIMRESGFYPAIERLEVFGPQGEIGLMQIMPNGRGIGMRPEHCSELLEGADCQIHTGVRLLAVARDLCPESSARWLAAYGLGRCPATEDEARSIRGVRRATHFLSQITDRVEW